MVSQTNERALEAAIEKALTGYSLEEIKEMGINLAVAKDHPPSGNGFHIGDANDFNAKYALDTHRFWRFLESTQSEELEKLQRSADWKARIWSGGRLPAGDSPGIFGPGRGGLPAQNRGSKQSQFPIFAQ